MRKMLVRVVRIRLFFVLFDGGKLSIHKHINPIFLMFMFCDDTKSDNNKLIDIVRLYVHLVNCEIGQAVINI